MSGEPVRPARYKAYDPEMGQLSKAAKIEKERKLAEREARLRAFEEDLKKQDGIEIDTSKPEPLIHKPIDSEDDEGAESGESKSTVVIPGRRGRPRKA